MCFCTNLFLHAHAQSIDKGGGAGRGGELNTTTRCVRRGPQARLYLCTGVGLCSPGGMDREGTSRRELHMWFYRTVLKCVSLQWP